MCTCLPYNPNFRHFESVFNQRKESEQKYRRLHRRSMDDCDKRIANAESIENNFNKEQFKQLCYLNKWLIENNITMTATDISANCGLKIYIKFHLKKINVTNHNKVLNLRKFQNLLQLCKDNGLKSIFHFGIKQIMHELNLTNCHKHSDLCLSKNETLMTCISYRIFYTK